jgi:hypothetical protein
MAARGITEEDVVTALRRRIGQPSPGEPGKIVVEGHAPGGKILKVCVLATDHETVIPAWWR